MRKPILCFRSLSIICLILSLFGCLSLHRRINDPYHESFYEKARLIMTEEEKKAYQELPDPVSKEEFIQEFWRIRDPDPSTEENENQMEFEDRIEFANEWFGTWNTFAGRSMGKGKEKDRGWRTARGRVYIILGPPDMVGYDMGWGPMRLYSNNRSSYESWYYNQYNIIVNFYRNIPESWRGDYMSNNNASDTPAMMGWGYELIPSGQLLYVMEDMKLNMINPDYREGFLKDSQFEAEYKEGSIHLTIPMDRVLFEEIEGRLQSFLQLKIDVYKDQKIIDSFDETKKISYSEDEVLGGTEILINIPYIISNKGNYTINLTLTDLNSMHKTKYRTVIKTKI